MGGGGGVGEEVGEGGEEEEERDWDEGDSDTVFAALWKERGFNITH